MTNDTSTCATCGHTWPRGQNGSHNCARELKARLNALTTFARACLDPEQYGYAVSPEVRNAARKVLGINAADGEDR